jgi:transposase-like protein
MLVLEQLHFYDEEAAFAFLEEVLWPNGPVCPHCGGMDRISKIEANTDKRVRIGLHKCGDCRKQFTVKVGTIFESAHIPLSKVLQAVYLMTCSKKSISVHRLHRILEITYKSTWFLVHRICEAMRTGELAPIGGPAGSRKGDETLSGKIEGTPKRMPRGAQLK